MRFRKGSKVEVLNKQEVPSGSWRCAEIVCSNRYYVTVKYDMAPTDEVTLENVARNLVRPRPPLVESPQHWTPGNIIEVLHNFSWKMATVSKVLRENHFMTRLVGSSTEVKVHKVNTRSRQSWVDEKWVLVGQVDGNQNDWNCKRWTSVKYDWLSDPQSKGIKRTVKSSKESNHLKNEEDSYFQESCTVSPKALKRGLPYCSQGRTHEGMWKSRLIEKDGGCHRVTVGDPYPKVEKVHHYDSIRETVGENEVCSLVESGKMFSGTLVLRIKGTIGKFCLRSLENTDSDTSSVGSCSIASTNPLQSRILGFPVDSANDHSSDAESTCKLSNEEVICSQSRRKQLTAEIHRAHFGGSYPFLPNAKDDVGFATFLMTWLMGQHQHQISKGKLNSFLNDLRHLVVSLVSRPPQDHPQGEVFHWGLPFIVERPEIEKLKTYKRGGLLLPVTIERLRTKPGRV